MTTIMTASNQWRSRPADQRFVSLHELASRMQALRQASRAAVVSSRNLHFAPGADMVNDLYITGPNGHAYAPTHWSLGQLAQLGGAPAGYLRSLPAALAADCLNYGYQHAREVEDVGVLLTREEGAGPVLRAATGPNYGRVWQADLADALVARFGDGVTGQWRVPGEFGEDVTVTRDNTTIYGSDRDMFVFLADEHNRVTVPNRRNGKAGTMARGFFVWNSETGGGSLGGAFFLFDYVCCNRIIWGAEQYKEVRIRHTSGAPDRWLGEVEPVLVEYANGSADPVESAIRTAQARKIPDVQEFIAGRFSRKLADYAMAAHQDEEGRPIETIWDAVTGLTAHARRMVNQDERVALERDAGKLLTV